MTDKEAMNVASQCRATASADLCKNILVDGGSGFLFELLLDAAKAIETLAQEKALQALHNENERLGLYRDAYAEQEPVAWGVFEGNLHDMFFTQEEAQEMASLKGSHAEVRPLYTTPPQRTEEPTKEMIDAAERIDWADSDVRGNIVNMWQAMSAVAPTPPQRTEQEPVAFKIYKPTPPRHAIPNVRDAELPWVYDQDPSSGNVASMWVTPVKHTHPPQRKPLTDEEIVECDKIAGLSHTRHHRSIKGQQMSPADDFWWHFARAIEAAHGITGKEQ